MRKNSKVIENMSKQSIGLALYLFLFFFLALYGSVFNITINQFILWLGGPILSIWIVFPKINSLRKLPPPYLLYGSLLIFSWFSFPQIIDSDRFYRYYQVLFTNLVLMVTVFYAIKNEREWFFQFEVLWITSIVVVVFSYFYEVDTDVDIGDFRLSGLTENANGIANYARIGILSALVTLHKNESKIKFGFLLSSIFILSYVLLITASRGAFINLLFIFSAYLTWRYFSGFKIILLAFILIISGSAVLSFLTDYLDKFYLYERLFSKGSFTETVENDARFNLYNIAWKLIWENPIFGVGLNQFRFYSGGLISHTDFLDIAVQLGLFASIIYLGIYLKLGKRLTKLLSNNENTRRKEIFVILIITFISEILFGLTNPNWFSQLQMVLLSLLISAAYVIFPSRNKLNNSEI